MPFTKVTTAGIDTTGTLITQQLSVIGIVSATAFYGSGANLTDIATTKNLTVGTRTTSFSISVVGTGMTLTLRSGIGTVNF